MHAQVEILKTIPGIADFTALTIASEIERFSDPEKLKSYAGLAPSVRNSADVVHHGHIT
ncbi:MAG: Transposase [Cenarchaeum symbiont of Oopsacas minuta]|nr:Transposase [Cenarchaeum symbiont of Oopsacas minuta]